MEEASTKKLLDEEVEEEKVQKDEKKQCHVLDWLFSNISFTIFGDQTYF